MTDSCIAKRLKVNGIVQGVGFRPFVFQLAEKFSLKGEVANTSSGVSIHIEGSPENVAGFEKDLAEKSPPLAYIVEISSKTEAVQNHPGFAIVKSKSQAKMSTLISPDVSVCEDCLGEMLTPDDRRYHYPFINCTNCGPRYTIIDDIPYDRPKTSMRNFKMCPRCQAEYDDPTDRRFHAQPNACADCGPHVDLFDNRRQLIGTGGGAVKKAAELLKQGQILAVKGLGGYHLAVDAADTQAVKRLRRRKLREEKPFAIMSYDLETIGQYARVGTEEEKLLTAIQRPIVLLKKKKTNAISKEVAPGNKYFGVMLPYTPLHYLLLARGFDALVMTSGNLSEEPIAIDNDDAFNRLGDIADYFLIHNRDIYLRSDDSIVRHAAGARRFLRRSRGFVPIPVFLKNEIPPILACGAELKNTICLTRQDKAFVSQHIGDLENWPTYEFFKLTIAHLKRILDIEPEIIACDMHPDYLSTRYALELRTDHKIQVQHHHAHIVSCMAEHKLEGELIGLSFDGTGYGTDGAIWGGEVLVAREHDFERAGHLAYVPMPGSATAIKEPWRMAVSYLQDAYGSGFGNLDLPTVRAIDTGTLTIIGQMISKGINSPLTSSLGRLFDGVAAICGIRQRVKFEGQAAMELEMAATQDAETIYDYAWDSAGAYRVLTEPIIRGVADDVVKGKPIGEISSRFHRTLICLFTDLCVLIGKERGLNRVVLSGGVFQNAILLTGLTRALEEKDFKVFSHQQVPTNDGGIALGQAVVAAAKMKR
ncbi:MAG: carbamoyltransferase HypF [Desulfobacteraceae bacterium]|nr:carbamoyltransferase HypF [Desulfobacteraceae bacterium]